MIDKIPAIFLKDGYKTGHIYQYPDGTTKVYSNFTARISRMIGVENVVVFGIQYFLKDFLLRRFHETFFEQSEDYMVALYQSVMDSYLGPGSVKADHIRALHKLKYLPLEIKALDEGTLAPLRIPILTIKNTHPDFGWLPNFLETLLSNVLWHPITSATIAFEYRKLLESVANETSDIPDFVKWQGHDFSMRGQTSLESSVVSGAAHLTSFTGSDTIPSLFFIKEIYKTDFKKELVAGTVPATEHSVMCLGGQETELETYRRLLTRVYPKGIVSIVSDTWNYWDVLEKTIPALKEEITQRDGKLVVRPDSGDPVKIILGDEEAEDPRAKMGTLDMLWNTFGGVVNSKGYKQFDSHIGVIYGDSITLERAKAILYGMHKKGYASTNIVFGIGSYTYQFVTRDTLGFAMKATWGEVQGEAKEIFKDPLTDGGVKKSAKGLLCVNDDMTLSECVDWEKENSGLLKKVFQDGMLFEEPTFTEIRNRIDGNFK